jgi:hypothetical protein
LASTITDLQIAATLNQAQLRNAKGKPFTKDIIKWIRYRYEIPAPVLKRPEEFTVKELAAHFEIGIGVVHGSPHAQRARISPSCGADRKNIGTFST